MTEQKQNGSECCSEDQEESQSLIGHFMSQGDSVLLKVAVESLMRLPDHGNPMGKDAGSLLVLDFSIGVENDLSSLHPEAAAPVHIVEEHGESFVHESHFVQGVPMGHQTCCFGLVYVHLRFMLKIGHLPSGCTLCWENPRQSAEFEKDVSVGGKTAAGGHDSAFWVEKLGSD